LAGFYTYLTVMSDYGFKPWTLVNININLGIEPAEGDVYNPLGGPCKGNSNCMLGEATWIAIQGTNDDAWMDLRLFFFDYDPDKWGECKYKDYPRFFNKSLFVKHNGEPVDICYGTEAFKYAATAFLVAVVHMQWMNLLVCKTRTLSISQ